MPKIPCPPEKQCTANKKNGERCTNARYRDTKFCYQHSEKGLKKQIIREKDGKLYRLTCDGCYLRDDCPHHEAGGKCEFTSGLKAYDLNDSKAYNRLLEKLIQMETEAYMRSWTMERETGKNSNMVSQRFMRLMSSMAEFKRNLEKEEAKTPKSLADLVKTE